MYMYLYEACKHQLTEVPDHAHKHRLNLITHTHTRAREVQRSKLTLLLSNIRGFCIYHAGQRLVPQQQRRRSSLTVFLAWSRMNWWQWERRRRRVMNVWRRCGSTSGPSTATTWANIVRKPCCFLRGTTLLISTSGSLSLLDSIRAHKIYIYIYTL